MYVRSYRQRQRKPVRGVLVVMRSSSSFRAWDVFQMALWEAGDMSYFYVMQVCNIEVPSHRKPSWTGFFILVLMSGWCVYE